MAKFKYQIGKYPKFFLFPRLFKYVIKEAENVMGKIFITQKLN